MGGQGWKSSGCARQCPTRHRELAGRGRDAGREVDGHGAGHAARRECLARAGKRLPALRAGPVVPAQVAPERARRRSGHRVMRTISWSDSRARRTRSDSLNGLAEFGLDLRRRPGWWVQVRAGSRSDFLGFTHYVTTTKSGRFRLGRKPIAKRMSRTLSESGRCCGSVGTTTGGKSAGGLAKS